MCKLCEIKSIRIAAPNIIPGFIVGEEKDQYYNKRRKFLKDSKIKEYLQKRHPEDINESKETYTMIEILRMVETTVAKEKLYHNDNPELITGDAEFANAFGPRLVLTSDIHMFVVRQMKTNINKKETGPIIKFTRLPPRHLPRWATEQATAVKAVREADISAVIDEDMEVSENLSKLMNTHNTYKEHRKTFNLSEILDTLTECLTSTDKAMVDKQNRTASIIKDKLLQDALGVTALDVTQLVSLAQYQTKRSPCERSRKTVLAVLQLLNINENYNPELDYDADDNPVDVIEVTGENLKSMTFNNVKIQSRT